MKQQLELEINTYIKRNSLKFSKPLEDLFYTDYISKSLTTMRIAIVLALVLYLVFGALDFCIASQSKSYNWMIRFGIVAPVLVLVLLCTYCSFFEKIVQPCLSIASLVMGFGIIAMIAITKNAESSMTYYAGLILVVMWSYTFVRLRFIIATIVCWTLVVGYELAAIFIQDVLVTPQLYNYFIGNNFFIIAASIIGMFVSYFIESYSRKDFLQQLMITAKQKDLEMERNRLRVRNDKMNNDLNMARNIQQQLIPSRVPNENIATFFQPMEPVGGDFYDFIEFREHERIGIFISDVSGHGASAALITSMIKSFISKSHKFREDPALLLFNLNESLLLQTGGNFVTAFYCIYCPVTHSITYSNAGHDYPYLIIDGKISYLDKGSSIPLAIFDNRELINIKKDYVNIVENLPPDAKLLLYTDGLIEASSDFNHHNQFRNHIEDVILKYHKKPCDLFIKGIYTELVAFCGSKSFSDDICLICVDVK